MRVFFSLLRDIQHEESLSLSRIITSKREEENEQYTNCYHNTQVHIDEN